MPYFLDIFEDKDKNDILKVIIVGIILLMIFILFTAEEMEEGTKFFLSIIVVLFTLSIGNAIFGEMFNKDKEKKNEIKKQEKKDIRFKQEDREKSNNKEVKKVEFEIPGILSKNTVKFSSSFVEYGSKRIYYKNITGLSYHSIKQYINFLPAGQNYYIVIEDDYNTIDIKFSSSFFFIGNKERKDLFSQIIYLSEKVIKPFLLLNLINQFSKDGYIKIASLTITTDNIRRERFLIGPVFLPLKEYEHYEIMQGNLMIYGKGNKHFCSIPLSVINVVALPEIIYFVREKDAILETEKKKEEKKKKYNINFCLNCGSKVEESIDFCTQCGKKIKR